MCPAYWTTTPFLSFRRDRLRPVPPTLILEVLGSAPRIRTARRCCRPWSGTPDDGTAGCSSPVPVIC
jgi:hypothetical protein